jgi:SAM-dependent methyltransferase
MRNDVYERMTCRLCDGDAMLQALSLPETPPANQFLALPKQQDHFPLEVRLCKNCGHAQLGHVVNPKLLYDNYLYVSGTSRIFIEHFRNYAENVKARFIDQSSNFVLEIGSNDGTLLSFFKGYRILGVEPAVEIAAAANANAIPTMNGYFSDNIANTIIKGYGKADVILANNVFAHIDDLAQATRAVQKCLADGGVFIIEVQYVSDLLSKGLFDMIYFEHLDYHAITPLRGFFARHRLKLFDVEFVETHGGSIRCFICHDDDKSKPMSTRLLKSIEKEKAINLNTLSAWIGLEKSIRIIKHELSDVLKSLKSEGKKIVAYGAPAKLTTLMYTLAITGDTISYVVDDNPLKVGRYTPGMHIPIYSSERIYKEEHKPDAILITAWNFSESIIKNHADLRGVTWITPLPRIIRTKND